MDIEMIDSQPAFALVDKMAAISAASDEDVAKIKAALQGLIDTVVAGSEQEHLHTGNMNVTVRRSPDCYCVRINVTTPRGRSKMETVHIEFA